MMAQNRHAAMGDIPPLEGLGGGPRNTSLSSKPGRNAAQKTSSRPRDTLKARRVQRGPRASMWKPI